MPNLLKATAKAVSKAAGPLGWPVEFATSLYEDELAVSRNDALLKAISEGTIGTSATLQELLQIQCESVAVSKQISAAFDAVIKFCASQPHLQNTIIESTSASSDDAAAEAQLETSLMPPEEVLRSAGMLTEQALIEELAFTFEEDVRLFLAIVQPAGFPAHQISAASAAFVVYRDFVIICRGLSKQQKLRIFSHLSAKRPGRKHLRAWAELFASTS